MTEDTLAVILRERYDQAKRNQTILLIDLFGIQYGEIIKKDGLSIKEIVRRSEIGDSYITEVTKAVKLSEYVSLKGDEGNAKD